MMKVSPTLLLLVAMHVGGGPLPAQMPPPSVSILDDPNPADFEIAVEEAPPAFAQVLTSAPSPAPPVPRQKKAPELSAEAQQYRLVIAGLKKNRHQFIHCKLKNGRVLTGLIRGQSELGFTLDTNALGGPFVRFEDLGETPRAVPAVGTRIKHGAQWTGVVLGLAVAIPLTVPLALVFYPLIAAGAIQD